MKDSSITALELDVKIRKIFVRLSRRPEEENFLQNYSLDSDLASTKLPIGLTFLQRKWKKLLGYVILYHYGSVDPVILVYYHLDLLDTLSETESYWLSVLVEDKDLLLKYLEKQEVLTEQQFFSGIVNEKEIRILENSIVLRFEERLKRPKRLVRRKGYRDKGSLGNLSTRVTKQECKNDFYLTWQQLYEEEQEIIRQESCVLLKEYLLEGRVLTDEQLVNFRIKKGVQYEQRSDRNSPEKDYIKQRSREELIRKDQKARREKERARIQSFETEFPTRKFTAQDWETVGREVNNFVREEKKQ